MALEDLVRSETDAARGRPHQPNPIDVHVGQRVRLRRTMLGLSQEKLGDALGLTFQQVQKYERGANRIGASRLYVLSQALDVPVSFFFDDLAREAGGTGAARNPGLESGRASFEPDSFTKRETLELVRAYYKIADPDVRKRVFDLAKALSRSAEGASE
ncbi:MAG: helix-turn-helix domain-containing protein [Alphaproteobacteria bacterium]